VLGIVLLYVNTVLHVPAAPREFGFEGANTKRKAQFLSDRNRESLLFGRGPKAIRNRERLKFRTSGDVNVTVAIDAHTVNAHQELFLCTVSGIVVCAHIVNRTRNGTCVNRVVLVLWKERAMYGGTSWALSPDRTSANMKMGKNLGQNTRGHRYITVSDTYSQRRA
jgi:hypothetical protein